MIRTETEIKKVLKECLAEKEKFKELNMSGVEEDINEGWIEALLWVLKIREQE